MTHHQALQDFPDTSQVSLHKKQQNQLTYVIRDAETMSLYMHDEIFSDTF
jgi:hypothetical protein